MAISRNRDYGEAVKPVLGSVVIALFLLAAAPAPVAQAASKRCGTVSGTVLLTDVRAKRGPRQPRCRGARFIARTWLRQVLDGRCSRFRCLAGGFRCRARPPARVRYRVRCHDNGYNYGRSRVGFTVVAD